MAIVAYQGESGANSDQACMTLFPDHEHRPIVSIRQVFEAVEVARVDLGLVPMDNSQAGSINETYDLFLRHGLHLVGEVAVPVDHCLMGLPGAALLHCFRLGRPVPVGHLPQGRLDRRGQFREGGFEAKGCRGVDAEFVVTPS